MEQAYILKLEIKIKALRLAGFSDAVGFVCPAAYTGGRVQFPKSQVNPEAD